MKMNTILGALTASLIGFLTGMIALLQQTGVNSLADVNSLAWIILAVGSAISFLKDFQAISVRRLINGATGTGDGGGKL